MESLSLKEVRLIVLIKETNNIDEINNFMYNYWNEFGIFVKCMRHSFSGYFFYHNRPEIRVSALQSARFALFFSFKENPDLLIF